MSKRKIAASLGNERDGPPAIAFAEHYVVIADPRRA
jgi:hypothetical protein